MKHYSVLSRGETIVVEVAAQRFKLDVLDVVPEDYACLYGDLDLEVDFALPKVRLIEEGKKKKKQN